MTHVHMLEMNAIARKYPDVVDRPLLKKLVAPIVTLLILAYLAVCYVSFDIHSVAKRVRFDIASLYLLDSYAHKIHVSYRFKKPEAGFVVSLEGNRNTVYSENPDWVQSSGANASIDLGRDGFVRVKDGIVSYRHPDYAQDFQVKTGQGAPTYTGRETPEWLRVSATQVDARPSLYSRIRVTKSRIEIQRYFAGWENFWFDFDSPLNGKSFGEVVSLAFSAQRLDPQQSNISLIFSEFWYNEEWLHGDIAYALLQTLVMAVVGTLIAGILALPMAFAAARNVNRNRVSRFGLRRLFDFLRGVDNLIWSLIFIRAFGLGPLSGTFAIFFTDTGTFGKLFSEAIENADKKQAEGVQATGASPVQKYRFGVFPQILPLFISQMLYYLESNTRSATVIGALGAGGIGLKLLETMRTRQDWENTTYIIALVIILVILIDNLSSWLRAKLIGGDSH
ncbi:phosphonate ABC transporter, permease protein PhnE [Polycladidibacter stylochi]|uniref:phosphonate ABC transporter, permease protein PhnE n=1 Tax=Polycladidibacter stylochi TaxID=1807766 RepID=UPI00083793F0|nr:phosphonate ABC transporter, permease protein PhnE [Pseudovibrio stylochi]